MDDKFQLTNTGKHVSATPRPAKGNVIDLLVVSNELSLDMATNIVHTTHHLACLYKAQIHK